METLYAPWRSDYTTSTERSKHENIGKDECVFCTILSESEDEKNFLLVRLQNSFILLNRFPYNAGHVLVLPNEHSAHLHTLEQSVRAEIMEAANTSLVALQKTLMPNGFNVGFNLGKAGGAGIPSHIHMHVLPRWIGDTSFLSTLSETKAVSFDLIRMYEKIQPEFAKISVSI